MKLEVVWHGSRLTGQIMCRQERGRTVPGHMPGLFTNTTNNTGVCQTASAPHINCPLYTLLSKCNTKDPEQDKKDVLDYSKVIG